MNLLQTAAATVALIGTLAGGILAAESRYVSTIDFDQFSAQYLRGEIRELERMIREETDPELREFLEIELEELLEEYCAAYPEDTRRCEDAP
jgi:hypothetical protein